MSDQDRLPIFSGPNGHTFDGRQFYSSLEKAQQARRQYIARCEKLAGRELSRADFRRGGLAREDDRDHDEKVRDGLFRPVGAANNDNPHRAEAERLTAETPQQRYARLRKQHGLEAAAADMRAEKWDEDHAPQENPDERRQRAIERAEKYLEAVRWSKDHSHSDIVRAEQALEQARVGDLDTADQMYRDCADRSRAIARDRKAAINQRTAAESASVFEPEAEPEPKPDPAADFMSEADALSEGYQNLRLQIEKLQADLAEKRARRAEMEAGMPDLARDIAEHEKQKAADAEAQAAEERAKEAERIR